MPRYLPLILTTAVLFALPLRLIAGPDAHLTVSDTVFLEPVLDTICNTANRITARPETGSYAWSTGEDTRSIEVSLPGRYTVTVTDAEGNVTVDPHDVIELFAPAPTLPIIRSEAPFCLGEEVVFEINLSGYDSLEWNNARGVVRPGFGAMDRFARFPFIPGEGVSYIAYYGYCNTSLTVLPPLLFSPEDQRPPPAAELTISAPDTLCATDTVAITLQIIEGDSVVWSDGISGAGAGATRELTAGRAEDLTVTVFGECGDSIVLVPVLPAVDDCPPPPPPPPPAQECEMRVPEIISANLDGTNDNFGGFGTCPLEVYTLRIFNQWGQNVYTSTDPAAPWDGFSEGQAQNLGTYLYQMVYRFADGPTERRDGQFVLVR